MNQLIQRKNIIHILMTAEKVLLSESQMNQLINGLKPVLKEIADNTLGEYRQLYVEPTQS